MEIDIFTLAHEIKNPLAISKGYLEMCNENNFSKYKDIIDSNINEALMILDSYLEYNKLSLNTEIMDVIFLLEDVISNFSELFSIKISIISVYDELFIDGDYFKLKQVFNNLIKNSIEANSTDIKIYLKIVSEYIVINVIDNGDGFNNVDNFSGYSSKINGNGIGLMITKKIIENHSGSIEYSNNLDVGSNITIKLLSLS